ncbi:Signal peptidase I [hydrothermal vent metagenome]|uniref:signal peptidase I n=1 Tax=hydrothermal vent metagenome TaxID=652676 RepID=A0A3B0YQ66_9ZZZZ
MNINLDFAFFLLSGTVITGLIWLLDSLALAPRRKINNPHEYSSEPVHGTSSPSNKEPILVEYSKSFFPVLLIVFLLRGFLVEPFRIPSGSMIPSLYIGDFILVNKFAYGVRMPVFNKVIFEMDKPERGDVAVFKYPKDPSIDYIKRVIGVPGDHIAYYNKVLYVNDIEVKHKQIGEYSGPGEYNPAREYTETLFGVEHNILLISQRPGRDAEYIVPEGHYFMMGDNRDNSNDSRYWGVVPEKYLVGKAFLIWMHLNNGNLFDGIGFKRMGQFIE